MADQEKKMRSTALSLFTRAEKSCNSLINAESPVDIVATQYEKVLKCWEKLESAHESFIEKTNIDIEKDKSGLSYLDEPAKRYDEVLLSYSKYCSNARDTDRVNAQQADQDRRKAEEDERKRIEGERKAAEIAQLEEDRKSKFESEKAEFLFSLDSFQRLHVTLDETMKVASDSDKRLELKRFSEEFSSLKDKLTGLSGMKMDITEINQKFVEAETKFTDTQKVLLSELKESSDTSGGDVKAIASSSSSSSTKKESVHLPKFAGDPKFSPFLKYPTWKGQWGDIIPEYEPKWRATLLWDHLDEEARKKFIGWESDYEESMRRLDRFYGDPTKVVQCVMKEVKSPQPIAEGDYEGLLAYSNVLESNFNRLKNIQLESEMSNTSAMYDIVRKFPRATGEKWSEYISSKDTAVKLKPFSEFIVWLGSQRETWERMAATTLSSSKQTRSYFAENQDRRDGRKTCHTCGEEGHISRFCPKASNIKTPKPRKKPTVKKFWCALHKDSLSRNCFSNACQELRKLPAEKRVKLMQENGDCVHCCGDHKTDDCPKKERVCGGGKENRGCSRGHAVHELFCKEAKCFAVSSFSLQDDEDTVVLQIMQVKAAKKGITASVIWDLCSSSNFVREEFARSNGFRGELKKLQVKTLGDVATDYTVMSYSCFLRDENGEMHTFKAFGMESITGLVSRIDVSMIRTLFPNISFNLAKKLTRAGQVDVLLGMQHASWHPERAERAKGGGDLWIYRGLFGSCIGGRHPAIVDSTHVSDSLFTVVESYFVDNPQHREGYSHHLEFCSSRVTEYVPPTTNISLEHHPSSVNVVMCLKASCTSMDAIEQCSSMNVTSPRAIEPGDSQNVASSEIESSRSSSIDIVALSEAIEPSSSIVALSEAIDPSSSVAALSEAIEPGSSTNIASNSIIHHLGLSIGSQDSISTQSDITNNETQQECCNENFCLVGCHHSIAAKNNLPQRVCCQEYEEDDVTSSICCECSITVQDLSVNDTSPGTNVSSLDSNNTSEVMHLKGSMAGLNVMAEEFEPRSTHHIVVPSSVLFNGKEDIVPMNNVVPSTVFEVQPSVRVSTETIPPHPPMIVTSAMEVIKPHTSSSFTVMGTCKDFFEAESLGVSVDPQCGGCKCGKCPISGAKFSFKEQQEYDVIQENLQYDEIQKRWYTEYPWSCERSTLPKNEKSAMQNLLSLEHRLSKNPEKAKEWCKQIQDMVDRGAAIVLPEEVVDKWKGDYYFLPMVGVKGKGKKAWLRVCFDASRRVSRHPAMNECLLKGPDKFMNNILSVLIGFRDGRVGCAADISKFHNRVHLVEKDIHMQRFYWRNLQTDTKPSVYAVAVNNFGVKPANCIATSALQKSADCFADVYPEESKELKEQIYVDDILTAAESKDHALTKTSRIDEIGEHAGMPNKGWVYTGDDVSDGVTIGSEDVEEKVLGISWIPITDVFVFNVTLKLRTKDGQEFIVTSLEEFLLLVQDLLITRRGMLSNVMIIFDPIGFLSPLILEGKLLLRESWCVPGIAWDDPLPSDQVSRWVSFLTSLLSLKSLQFHRSLWPDEEVVGFPILVIFSDGSALAYGAVAYIRWELRSGGFWSRIIMSKCKIAPKHIVSVPRMELNGAVTGNRIKNFIQKETNLKFSKTYQFVDSSTVLGYVHKQCGIFNPYEGLRVAEIQSSNVFVNGRLVGWAWVAGEDNPSDWCTKSRTPKDMVVGGFWDRGPGFVLKDESTWPIKWTYRTDRLEGEVQLRKQVICAFLNLAHPDFLGRLLNRGSCLKRIIRVLAWMLRVPKRTVPSKALLSSDLKEAKMMLIQYSQSDLLIDLQRAVSGKGRYRKLAPVLDNGVWRVGSRMRHHVPFTFDSKMPIIVPPKHRFTLLAMEEAHNVGHTGQDGTLNRFRTNGYWTTGAGRIAKSVKGKCVDCRKDSGKLLVQPCGEIPAERLTQPVAWGYCQLDLFGPFKCRGDVNPRTSKKTWGFIIEDVNAGAVYIDIVSDYSTAAVLMTMRRFGSLRGWPGVIYSDPGSQLESASSKFESWWNQMERALATFAGKENFRWETSPADSPWRQGKVERRIAIIKKHIKHAIGDSRVTPLELQTILFEIANVCNERPITVAKPRDDGTYNLVTPNQLLMGRSINRLPDDAELSEDLPVTARYRLINHITTAFWKSWSNDVSPSLIVRQKWHVKSRNLQGGDLVMITEPSKLKAKYKLAIVENVTLSRDGCVRSAVLRYNNVQPGADNPRATPVRVTRSVQRLVLVLPVEEQSSSLMVIDNDRHISIVADNN